MPWTKSYADSPWKQRAVFFVAGILVCALWVRSLHGWIEGTPDRLRDITGWTVVLLPIAAVFLVQAIRGERVRATAYLLGATVPLVVGAWRFPREPIAGAGGAHPFDARQWRAQIGARTEPWTPRLRMVGDLLATRRLDGLSRAEVVELLGPPSDLDYLEDVRPTCDLWYSLGPLRDSLDHGSQWLLVAFDEDGHVRRYWRWSWKD
jgi:hypothetical protein